VKDTERLWTSCADVLQAQVSEAVWNGSFAEVEARSTENGELLLLVPNSLVKERIEHRFLNMVQDALDESGGWGTTVRVEVNEPAAGKAVDDGGPWPKGSAPSASDAEDADSVAEGRAAAGNGSARSRRLMEAPLNPVYTFEAFVIGNSNRFAHAAARSAAETPARSYNPLFIYGGAGLGKTHLLHAIGNYVREQYPARLIKYVSMETFMNEFVDAIRTNAKMAFTRRYRECDVLLVDDIHFVEGKESLQEEFFHTFNHLYQASSQIVLTSDKHPRAIPTLSDRLRSRFLSGLITDVQPPELETRLAILQKKAESDAVQVPHDVLLLIADNVKDNIRELEGALTRVVAYASLNVEVLTLALAEKVLADVLAAGEPRPITPKDILNATSEMFDFTVEELCGPSRRRPLVIARQISMYVFRQITDFSYPAIAREFGGRDHTTVIHAVDKISGLMKERRPIYDQVTELMQRVRGGG
jgi:chromosomal replication initiator protein